jgi:hypothetical protein
MKKKAKKLVLAKETLSLITTSVVGGVLTDGCVTHRPDQCPTDPNWWCQTNPYGC